MGTCNEPLEREIPHLDLFMMCRAVHARAFTEPPHGYHVRNCRPDELAAWKRMQVESPAHLAFMDAYYDAVYAPCGDRFFNACLFLCDADDVPVGTCFVWEAYGRIPTVHWFKVLKEYEGRGFGRAILSAAMRQVDGGAYPVYLHTHPASYRAIALYADFGFSLLRAPAVIGTRRNHFEESLPILRENLSTDKFESLRFEDAPAAFLRAVESSETEEF